MDPNRRSQRWSFNGHDSNRVQNPLAQGMVRYTQFPGRPPAPAQRSMRPPAPGQGPGQVVPYTGNQSITRPTRHVVPRYFSSLEQRYGTGYNPSGHSQPRSIIRPRSRSVRTTDFEEDAYGPPMPVGNQTGRQWTRSRDYRPPSFHQQQTARPNPIPRRSEPQPIRPPQPVPVPRPSIEKTQTFIVPVENIPSKMVPNILNPRMAARIRAQGISSLYNSDMNLQQNEANLRNMGPRRSDNNCERRGKESSSGSSSPGNAQIKTKSKFAQSSRFEDGSSTPSSDDSNEEGAGEPEPLIIVDDNTNPMESQSKPRNVESIPNFSSEGSDNEQESIIIVDDDESDAITMESPKINEIIPNVNIFAHVDSNDEEDQGFIDESASLSAETHNPEPEVMIMFPFETKNEEIFRETSTYQTIGNDFFAEVPDDYDEDYIRGDDFAMEELIYRNSVEEYKHNYMIMSQHFGLQLIGDNNSDPVPTGSPVVDSSSESETIQSLVSEICEQVVQEQENDNESAEGQLLQQRLIENFWSGSTLISDDYDAEDNILNRAITDSVQVLIDDMCEQVETSLVPAPTQLEGQISNDDGNFANPDETYVIW